MHFSYHTVYSVFILALFIFYNPTLCHELFKYTPEELIDRDLFHLQKARIAFSLNIKPITYPDKCELKQLNLISRHGSRYPDPDDYVAYGKLEKVFANVPVAKNWVFQMVKRGELEMFYDGLQSRKRYSKFWKGVKYDPEVIKFQSSATSRAGASSMAYSEGLFNGKGSLDTCKSQPVYTSSIPEMQDGVLVPWISCTRWFNTVYSNNSLFDEQSYIYGNNTLAPIAERISKAHGINPPLDPRLVPFIFTNCQFYIAVYNRTDTWYKWAVAPIAERISKAHGINPPLDPRLVPFIFTNCQFYIAVYNRTDTWCTLLKPDEFLLIRYYWDMRVYYLLQYGNPMNRQVGCAYITQLVNEVDSYLNGTSPTIANLKFAHSYTMLMIFTSMGLLKEERPLTADFTLEEIKKVKKTEFVALHWGSTFYLEVYTCPEGKASIRAVLNYKPLLIPGCESEYCDWKTFKHIFRHLIGCDFWKLCAYP
ncbi:7683_t:CDS:2 [Entrophospora sp. SA101]|nr:7683_t:CDS:2 [Entrophospora sp. SA101]